MPPLFVPTCVCSSCRPRSTVPALPDLLDKAPVIESQGRAFPGRNVSIANPIRCKRLEDQVTAAVLAALREHEGSALVFLPGQGEITRVAERLAGRVPASTDIAPLYGQLTPSPSRTAPSARPNPAAARSCWLLPLPRPRSPSMACASSSTAVSAACRPMNRAPASPRSKPAASPAPAPTSAAAAPAAPAPGVVIRLWNEGQTAALDPFDTPEILAADLAGLALDLANWGVTDPDRSALSRSATRAGLDRGHRRCSKSLDVARCQSGRHHVSDGKALARLPLHPRLAHMVVAGCRRRTMRCTAAELAVLIGERGLGCDGTDLAHRLDRFRTDRSKRADDARSPRPSLGQPRQTGPSSAAGSTCRGVSYREHLARAYPDRIAQAAGPRGKFRLANGRQASLDATDALAAAGVPRRDGRMTGAAATSSHPRCSRPRPNGPRSPLRGHRITATETLLTFDPMHRAASAPAASANSMPSASLTSPSPVDRFSNRLPRSCWPKPRPSPPRNA
jgi:ATP-dependent helicase HrpB